MMLALAAFTVSLVMALFLVPLAGRVARRLERIDHPRLPIKAHPAPVPDSGGLAIFVAFLVPFVALVPRFGVDPHRLTVLLVGAGAVFLLGLADDFRDLSVGSRLIGQTAVALALAAFGFRIEAVFLSRWLAVTLSVLWIVGMTNALNLIDIMDGLAAGVTVIACAAFFAMAALVHQPLVPLASASLAGACLGFLAFNFSPASIYMGNAGSYLLGLVLAALALETSRSTAGAGGSLVPVLILWVPLMDTLLVMVFRARKGVSVFRASNDHFPMRMVAAGATRKQAVLIIYAATALVSAATVLSARAGPIPTLLTAAAVLLLSLVIARRLDRLEPTARPREQN